MKKVKTIFTCFSTARQDDLSFLLSQYLCEMNYHVLLFEDALDIFKRGL